MFCFGDGFLQGLQPVELHDAESQIPSGFRILGIRHVFDWPELGKVAQNIFFFSGLFKAGNVDFPQALLVGFSFVLVDAPGLLALDFFAKDMEPESL